MTGCHAGVEEKPNATSKTRARVALVGNSNVGKSTLFNALTGAHQQEANWPGTTVHVARASWTVSSGVVELIDLPGTQSLVPQSPGEALVRDLLYAGQPADRIDLVVLVLDAANLAPSLYLASQVLDSGVPAICVLTMADIAAAQEIRIDTEALARGLGIPVLEVQPRRRTGLPRLAEAIPTALGALSTGRTAARLPVDECDIAAAEARYDWVHQVLATAMRRPGHAPTSWSDRIDRILISRWLGLPIFGLVMWGLFVATTRLATPLQEGLAWVLDGPVTNGMLWALRAMRLDGTWVSGLAVDGLVAGVGQVLTFAPLMLIMFTLLAILEDSGYMARAAFVSDRMLRLLGLPGQAFLPLIVGFGCNVPAIYGARILGNPRHRLLVGLLVPFVTCSARMAGYVLLAAAFFGSRAGTVVFAMYVLSVALVVLVWMLLRHTVFRNQPSEPLILMLPPYRLPTVRVIAVQTRQKLLAFFRKAGCVIVATVVAVWLLMAIPMTGGSFAAVPVPDCLDGAASRAMAPVFTPAGFGDWHATGRW